MIAALDAWFDRVAGAVHAFEGEALKLIGDGVLAIFPVTAPAEACEAALRAVIAARAGMAHLDGGAASAGAAAASLRRGALAQLLRIHAG
jgi:adenylate cyclase